jgi:hypothetical protein
MTCDNYHATPQSSDCPYCVILALIKALEKIAPNDPALPPGRALLCKSERERAKARRAAR